MNKEVVVVYGSGSSFDSGYQVRIEAPCWKDVKPDTAMIPPPCDQQFFSVPEVWKVAKTYRRLAAFITKYFGVPFDDGPCNLGLEQVWSAVDLSYKHLRLGTYTWKGETEAFLRSSEALNLNEDEQKDRFDTDRNRERSDNPVGGNEFYLLGGCGRSLRQLIYRVYGQPVLQDKTGDNFIALHKLLLEQACKVEYVTFNYDSCLERSLKRNDVECSHVSDRDSGGSLPFREGHPRIYKLHGSLTWTHQEPSVKPLTIENLEENPWNKRGDQCNFLAVKSDYRDASRFTQAAIIPPTWFKQEINDDSRTTDPLTQLMLYQWRRALAALSRAKAVIIVGYSFPETDLHAKWLFTLAQMLQQENDFRVLYCTKDPQKEQVCQRLEFLHLRKCVPVPEFSNLSQPSTFKGAKGAFSELFN